MNRSAPSFGRIAFLMAGVFLHQLSHAAVPQGPAQVSVRVHQLTIRPRLPDGTLGPRAPFVMKGVTWNPATAAPPTGLDPVHNIPTDYGYFFDWNGRNPQGNQLLNFWFRQELAAHYTDDLRQMKSMNVNTVRLYFDLDSNPLDDAMNQADYQRVLDACYENGIMVILSVAYSGTDLDSGRYLKVVEMAKNHPAILMWAIGNEWNFSNLFTYASAEQATAAVNTAAQRIKAIDPNHPVTSILGDVFSVSQTPGCGAPDLKMSVPAIVSGAPSVDIWGLNIYRGKSFGDLFKKWSATSDKPFFLSEFGTDSYHTASYTLPFPSTRCEFDARAQVIGQPDETMQADFVMGLWNEVLPQLSGYNAAQQCVGGLIHEWNDELWKVGSFHAGGKYGLGELVIYPPDPAAEPTYQQQNPQGFVLSGHPDGVANEEYFGIVDGQRRPKKLYGRLQSLYASLIIADPVLTLDEPAGGEVWTTGASVTIRWRYEGMPLYASEPTKILLMEVDAGGADRQIFEIRKDAVTNMGSNSVSWTVPADLAGDNLHVVVTFDRFFYYPTFGGGKTPMVRSQAIAVQAVESAQSAPRPTPKPRLPIIRGNAQ